MKKKYLLVVFVLVIAIVCSLVVISNNAKPVPEVTEESALLKLGSSKSEDILNIKSIEVVSPSSGTYKAGEVIKIKVTWSKDVYSALKREITKLSAPNMLLVFEKGFLRNATFESSNKNEIIYTLKINKTDKGVLKIAKYSGIVRDLDGNRGVFNDVDLTGNTIMVGTDEATEPEKTTKPTTPEKTTEPEKTTTPPKTTEPEKTTTPTTPEKTTTPTTPEKTTEPEKTTTPPKTTEPEKTTTPIVPEIDIRNIENMDLTGLLDPEDLENMDTEEPIFVEEPTVSTAQGNSTKPNGQTADDKIAVIKEAYRVVSGVRANGAEVLRQIKSLNVDWSSLSLIDVVQFALEIKKVYGEPKDTGVHVYTNSRQLAKLATSSYANNSIGPIGIAQVELTSNGKTQNVYLLSLGGTEFVDGQATDITTDIVTGLEFNNDYLKSTYNAILDNIPLNSKLVITGISLGGMIAQQVASQQGIKDNYEILNIVGYGSPIITPSSREGTVRRLCDVMDIVPMLSISNSVENVAKYDSVEKMVENGGYKTPIGTHTFSYVASDVWNKYDVLGMKNGNATMKINIDEMVFCEANFSK